MYHFLGRYLKSSTLLENSYLSYSVGQTFRLKRFVGRKIWGVTRSFRSNASSHETPAELSKKKDFIARYIGHL